MKEKGFTLVELLVTIVILGIVSALAIPSIINISNKNNNKKYKTYGNSLISSTKLYIDSFGEDLFSSTTSGCRDISLNTLIGNKLAKDIDIENETCNNKDTFVRVIKLNNTYTYKISLKCTNKSDNTVIYKSNEAGGSNCSEEEVPNGPTIYIDKSNIIEDDTKNNTKDKKIKVTISSFYGLEENASIYYNFSTDADGNNLVSNAWTQRELRNKNAPKINYNELITIDTSSLQTGKYYLIVRLTDDNNNPSIKDSTGNPPLITKYISGPYIVDKTSPVAGDATVEEDGDYLKYVGASAYDETNGLDYTVCLSGNNTCNNFRDIYSAKILKSKIKDKVYIYLKDASGNISVKEINY